MKRFLILCVVLAFVAAIPLSHSLMAQKADKVKLCHLTKLHVYLEKDQVAGEMCAPASAAGYWNIGHIIIVSANAKQAHLDHGDTIATDPLKSAGDCCKRWSDPQ